MQDRLKFYFTEDNNKVESQKQMKRIMKKLIIAIFLVFLFVEFSTKISAKDYYLSNTGNDKASGKTPKSSFKTLQRLSQVRLKPGDKVYFKSGDTFSGTLHINYSGKKGKPIIFTSYGEGNKPVITGTLKLQGFSKEGENIYSIPCKENIKYLYKDNQIMTLARYPNAGFLEIDDGGADFLIDSDLPFEENQLKGATAYVQFYVWLYKYRTVSSNTNNTLKFDKTFNPDPEKEHLCKNGRNYYLDNKKAFLDSINEWYYSAKENKLFIYSDKPIDNNYTLTGSFTENGVALAKGVSHIQIKNLQISGQTKHGLAGPGANNNIEIINNEFSEIGEYGIYFEKHATELTIKNNVLYNITGNGIRTMHASNSLIEGNTVKNIGTITGYGISGLNNASGICVLNYEKHYDDTLKLSHNNIIRDNHINNIGYNGIRFEGYNTICEKNTLKNCTNTLHDGGLIYTWGKDTMYTFNNVIRENIVIGAKTKAEGSHQIQIGIYVDNNVRDVTVSNNIVANVKGGMTSNWATTRSVFKNNLVYGSESGLTINVLDDTCFANHSATGNKYIILENRGKTFVLANHRGTKINTGEIDRNLYVAPKEKFYIRLITVDKERKDESWLTLKGWQKEMNVDKNSEFFVPEKDGKTYPFSDIFINEGDIEKKFPLETKYNYIDLEGNVVKDEIKLKARQAKVVFYRVK